MQLQVVMEKLKIHSDNISGAGSSEELVLSSQGAAAEKKCAEEEAFLLVIIKTKDFLKKALETNLHTLGIVVA